VPNPGTAYGRSKLEAESVGEEYKRARRCEKEKKRKRETFQYS
jgi:hypothetical protein